MSNVGNEDEHFNESVDSNSADEIGQFEALFSIVASNIKREIDDLGLVDDYSRIGKFEIRSVLGRGGQAFCFRAFDTELRRDVVLKIYRSDLSVDQKEQIISEARAFAKVNNPRVAQCYSVDYVGGSPFLVLEFVSGQTLSSISDAQALSCSEALEIAIQIIDALDAIHEKGLLHLDLKPNNIVVDANRQLKVIDFGMSQNDQEIDGSTVAGAPAYISPEVASNSGRLDQRTDIYGLGAIMFYLLTGSAPVQGNTKTEVLNKVASGQFDETALLDCGASKHAIQFCRRCLQTNPADRFAGVADARKFIVAPKLRRKKIFQVLASAAVFFLLAVITFLMFRPATETTSADLAMRIRSARLDQDFSRVMDLEKLFYDRDSNVSIKRQMQRSERWASYAEREGDFEQAMALHNQVLTNLKQDTDRHEFDIPIREQQIECCKQILKLPMEERKRVAQAFVFLYRARETGETIPSHAISDFRSGLEMLDSALGSNLLTAVWTFEYLDMQDAYDHKYWEGREDEFERRLTDAHFSLVECLGADHPLTFEVDWLKANHLFHTINRTQAPGHLRKYASRLEAAFGNRDSKQLATAYFCLALADAMIGDRNVDFCQKTMGKSIALRKRIFGNESLEVAELFQFQSRIMEILRRPDDAELAAKESVSIINRLIENIDEVSIIEGPSQKSLHFELAEALIRLGECVPNESDLSHFQNSRQILEDRHQSSLQYASLVASIATIHLENGKLEIAEREIEAAITAYTKVHTSDGVYASRYFSLRARLKAKRGNLVEAITDIKQLISSEEQRGGPADIIQMLRDLVVKFEQQTDSQ